LIWKSAEVVPVPKIHPPASIQNDLRSISLLLLLGLHLDASLFWTTLINTIVSKASKRL